MVTFWELWKKHQNIFQSSWLPPLEKVRSLETVLWVSWRESRRLILRFILTCCLTIMKVDLIIIRLRIRGKALFMKDLGEDTREAWRAMATLLFSTEKLVQAISGSIFTFWTLLFLTIAWVLTKVAVLHRHLLFLSFTWAFLWHLLYGLFWLHLRVLYQVPLINVLILSKQTHFIHHVRYITFFIHYSEVFIVNFPDIIYLTWAGLPNFPYIIVCRNKSISWLFCWFYHFCLKLDGQRSRLINGTTSINGSGSQLYPCLCCQLDWNVEKTWFISNRSVVTMGQLDWVF